MDLDDKICLCFGVSKRKVINFCRVEKPRVAGQLSECFGAGTGCGWCRPFLREIFEQQLEKTDSQIDGTVKHQSNRNLDSRENDSSGSLTPERYAELRAGYLEETERRPPNES